MCQFDFTTFLIMLPQENKEILEGNAIRFKIPREHNACPSCGGNRIVLHQYRDQKLHGIVGETTYIYRKRRYLCRECGKTFFEENPFLKRYQRMPQSVIAEIVKEHGEIVSASYLARRHNVSPPTIIRHFIKAMETQEEQDHGTMKQARVLSMDEFRGNVGARFQVALHDLETRTCLDIYKSKGKEELRLALEAIPNDIRQQVETFSIDLSPQFRSYVAEYFPNATVAADKFHAEHLANMAMNTVRIQEVEKSKVHVFQGSRKILLSRSDNLTPETKKKLEVMLDTSEKLRLAYQLKEEYFRLFESKTRKEYSTRLKTFAKNVEEASLKSFKTVLKTTQEWHEEIWHGIETGYNNGFTEGCNNVIKTLKRTCFGFRNFKHFRFRVLAILNNESRKERREKLRSYIQAGSGR